MACLFIGMFNMVMACSVIVMFNMVMACHVIGMFNMVMACPVIGLEPLIVMFNMGMACPFFGMFNMVNRYSHYAGIAINILGLKSWSSGLKKKKTTLLANRKCIFNLNCQNICQAYIKLN
ncbi:hypothetical protein CHS0354_000201 [Potamilus streckersoni]|uniref:Uncharacterized protein n=1 Tax=Potamilus streckersoni TaxID=2493646 RepID=A0AAE0VIN4_9BIVA|nr:hypothetical protein CHS0354_000201 [Potamilus streckersoni]